MSTAQADIELLTPNGPSGALGQMLAQNDFDPSPLRQFIHNGSGWMMKNGQAVRVRNSNATLRYDEFRAIDRQVALAARHPLNAWSDLASAVPYDIPNGLGVAFLTSQAASDPGSADISLNGNGPTRDDRQLFDLRNTPLPIISSGFSYSARELAMGRKLGTPLDVSRAEAASRRVAETLEDLTLGVRTWAGMGGNVYGLTNYPNRISGSVTSPEDNAWTPATFVAELLDIRQALVDAKFTGPFRVYVSSAWDAFLDDDYKANSDITLRTRVGQIQNLSAPRTVFGLTGYQVIVVQMTSSVLRAITGMPLMTLQWSEKGGWETHYRVMTIAVPEMRNDFYGNCGIYHAVAA